MHIYESMSQTFLTKSKYTKYYSNQISKHFDNQKRVFKGVVFCTRPRDFIPLKRPVVIGLIFISNGQGLPTDLVGDFIIHAATQTIH